MTISGMMLKRILMANTISFPDGRLVMKSGIRVSITAKEQKQLTREHCVVRFVEIFERVIVPLDVLLRSRFEHSLLR